MENQQNIRNSSLELLRIISMILIVAHHYVIHGITSAQEMSFLEKNVIDIIQSGGKIGVVCFILITGYFMVDSKFSFRKFWRLWGEVIFYSYIILLLVFVLGINEITIKAVIKAIFPVMYSEYWFITCYMILMIISPWLNKLIHNCNKKELKNFILTLSFLWIISSFILGTNLYINDLEIFIIYYIISAYIKLHTSFDERLINKSKFIFFVFIVLLILTIVASNLLGLVTNILWFYNNSRHFSELNSILVLIISVSMFVIFINKKDFKSLLINNIAKSTLGVYLIHDNLLIRDFLWKEVLKCNKFASSALLLPHAIISILIVFVICIIIDYSRIKLIEPCWMKVYDSLEGRKNAINSNKF